MTAVLEIATTIILAFGGTSLILIGCSTWLGKVWASRILEADRAKYSHELARLQDAFETSHRRLQGELDKALHVYRIQFEVEFNALVDIWAKLSLLRTAMAELSPSLPEHVDLEEPEDARLARRAAALSAALNALKRAVDDHAPFCPEDLVGALDNAIRIAVAEETQVTFGREDMPRSGWSVQRNTSFRQFKDAVSKVSDLIRKRLSDLRVVN